MSSPSQVSSGPPLPTERVPSSTCSPWGLGSCYSHHILENHRTVVSTSSIPLTPKFHPNDPFSQGYAHTPFLLFKTALPPEFLCFASPWLPAQTWTAAQPHCCAQQHRHCVHTAPSGTGPPLWAVIPEPSTVSGTESVTFFLLLKHCD